MLSFATATIRVSLFFYDGHEVYGREIMCQMLFLKHHNLKWEEEEDDECFECIPIYLNHRVVVCEHFQSGGSR